MKRDDTHGCYTQTKTSLTHKQRKQHQVTFELFAAEKFVVD